MKKLFFLISTLIIFILLAEITSCFNPEDDEKAEDTISIKTDTSIGTISLSVVKTGVKYVNVIRYSCTSEDFDTTVNVMNIAQIVPSGNYGKSPFQFTDKYTVSGKYYKYAFRYFDGTKYSWSEKTKATEGAGSGEDNEITVTTNPVPATYTGDEQAKTYQLTIPPDITLPAGFEELYIALNNGSLTKPVLLQGSVTAAITSDINKGLDVSVLPESFVGKKLTAEGLVAINKSTVNSSTTDDAFTIYEFTQLAKTNVTTTYTNEDGTDGSSDYDNGSQDYIYIPVPESDDNPFDLTTPRSASVQSSGNSEDLIDLSL